MKEQFEISCGKHRVTITNPSKVLWPDVGLTKLDYIRYLIDVASVLLPYAQNRPLMIWRYPDGVASKRIVQKAIPKHAPEWISRASIGDKDYILLNNVETLIWTANYGALEFHVPFAVYPRMDTPTHLAFDLDPSVPNRFDVVSETALELRRILLSLGLESWPKTSGATGLQIFVPIQRRYTFAQTRPIMRFLSNYLVHQMPSKLTVERSVKARGVKLYVDYLQLWKMRTLSTVYSVRSTPFATVSTPLKWSEIERGVLPTDFTTSVVRDRVKRYGDLFATPSAIEEGFSLDEILSFMTRHAL